MIDFVLTSYTNTLCIVNCERG